MDPVTRLLMQGAAGAAVGGSLGIEDVFSTWLYAGNGSTQTITNGIDLAGEGGLVWSKSRNFAGDNTLFDTARGAGDLLISNSTAAAGAGYGLSFLSDGFSLTGFANAAGYTYASWTFRKAPGFFDVVTYTGNGTAGRTIAHNLGSVPGCIIVKSTSSAIDWQVYHRSTGATQNLVLNSTAAVNTSTIRWNNTEPTASVFTLGSGSQTNANGETYVAYLFAHDAGGFGDSGNESVIKCGSFTTDGSYNSSTTLGWEPQWVLVKSSSATGGWFLFDNMRGMPVSGNDNWLYANASGAESNSSVACRPNATGFTTFNLSANTTHIYIAIRRGPMKTPTDATKVFKADETAVSTRFSTGFDAVDLSIQKRQDLAGTQWFWASRLTGNTNALSSDSTAAEAAASSGAWEFDLSGQYEQNYVINPIMYLFRRAPGFFDVVAYTGTGANNRALPHNLGVKPEFAIFKERSAADTWVTFSDMNASTYFYMFLESSSGGAAQSYGSGARMFAEPNSTNLYLSDYGSTNQSGQTYIAYLFATCPGVSKVGSYTGTGTTLNVDCGFTAGARFVLIKRTDSTGDWYVWDTTRGIVSGNDPYLLLNTTAAEVTSTDYIDPLSSGFQISSTAPAAINASGGSFIFLAVA